MVGITGVGSGIDIDSIVKAMVNAEKAPKEAQLARLEKSTTTKFSALGQLKSALSEFQTALKALSDFSLFEKRTASSSDTSALTLSATKNALPGTYQIEVGRLATASKVASATVGSGFSSGAGEEVFTVKLGVDDAGTEVRIAAGSDLASTRDQLNAALKDKGISVNIVGNPGTGESRLVYSSTKTGAGEDVIVTGSGSLAALDVDGTQALNSTDPASAGYITQAADAQFSIDGLALTSASNSVTGAIPEVTLELLTKTEANKPLTVSVGQNSTGVTDAVNKFVEAYNKLIKTSNQLTSVVSVGDGKPPVAGGLVGDATVRNVLSAVRNQLVNPVNGQGDLRVLADLGIVTEKDGTLKVDADKLKVAVEGNFEAVGAFFAGESGLMQRLDKSIDGFIKTGGVLEQRMNGLQSTIKDIDKQKENLNLRIDKVQARLYAQFNAMDMLVGQLNQTSDRLAQSLASLPGFVKKDS